MASPPSILILGPDTVAAAEPATPVQLIHACRRWGFTSVVPSSWGDELIATDVIRRCAARDSRPVVQCSCPLVAERLARHAAVLDDAVFWLVSPPVAVARYLRAIEADREIHLTYAGGCPGAVDASIDERITPRELFAAITSRGIDIARQPTVFDDVIPPDRRRHASSPAGLPEQHQLWNASAFRVTQPGDGDLAITVAQLLLAEERLLIDLSQSVGCACRQSGAAATVDAVTLHRSPTPVVVDRAIDLARAAPVQPAALSAPSDEEAVVDEKPETRADPPVHVTPSRSSGGRPYRRQSVWRRQSPRGVVVVRPSSIALAVSERVPLLRRPQTRWVITALLVAAAMLFGVWVGRRSTAVAIGSIGLATPIPPARSTPPGRSRLP